LVGAPLARFEEFGLSAEGIRGVAEGIAGEGAIWLHETNIGFVLQIGADDVFADVPAEALVLDGEEDFDATVEVARHHVC